MPIHIKFANPSPICLSNPNSIPICQSITNSRIHHLSGPSTHLSAPIVKTGPSQIGRTLARIDRDHANPVPIGGQSRSGTGNKITVEVWPKCLDGGRLRKSRLQYFYTPTANLWQSTNPMSILCQSPNPEPIYRRYMTNLQIAGQWNTNSVTIC